MLAEAGEVLINQKAITRFEVELDGEAVSRLRSLVREELRRALENLVKNRDVPLLIVDEASALLMTRKRMSPLLPFEILKSLAVVLKIPIILSGAYDLLGILDGTGQLVRRSDVVHLSRYMAEGSTEDFVDGHYVLVPGRRAPGRQVQVQISSLHDRHRRLSSSSCAAGFPGVYAECP